MKKIPEKFDLHALIGVTVASLLVQAAIYIWVKPDLMMGAFPISRQHFWVSYIYPPTRMFEFLAGMFTARLLISGRARVLSKTTSFVLLAAAYIGSMYIPWQFSMSVVFILPVCLLILSMAGDDLNNRKTVLNSKNAVWLGEISYAFYMIQFLVLFYFLNLTAGKKFSLPEGVALICVALVLSVSLASVIYKYFEVPMMKFILGKYKVRKLASAV